MGDETLEGLRNILNRSDNDALATLFRWSTNGHSHWLTMARRLLHTTGLDRNTKTEIYDRLQRLQRIATPEQRAEIEFALQDRDTRDLSTIAQQDRDDMQDFIEMLHLVELSYDAKRQEPDGRRVVAILTDRQYDFNRNVGRRVASANDRKNTNTRYHAETRAVLGMTQQYARNGMIRDTTLYVGDMCCLTFLQATAAAQPDGRSIQYHITQNGIDKGKISRSQFDKDRTIIHTHVETVRIMDANYEYYIADRFSRTLLKENGKPVDFPIPDYYRVQLDQDSWLFYEVNGDRDFGMNVAYPRELHIEVPSRGGTTTIILEGCAVMMPYLWTREIIYIRAEEDPCIKAFLTGGIIPTTAIAKTTRRALVKLHQMEHKIVQSIMDKAKKHNVKPEEITDEHDYIMKTSGANAR